MPISNQKCLLEISPLFVHVPVLNSIHTGFPSQPCLMSAEGNHQFCIKLLTTIQSYSPRLIMCWRVSTKIIYLLSIHLSIHLSIKLSTYLSIHLSIHLSIKLFTYLSIHPSIYLSIHLSIYLSTFPRCRFRTFFCGVKIVSMLQVQGSRSTVSIFARPLLALRSKVL